MSLPGTIVYNQKQLCPNTFGTVQTELYKPLVVKRQYVIGLEKSIGISLRTIQQV